MTDFFLVYREKTCTRIRLSVNFFRRSIWMFKMMFMSLIGVIGVRY